MPIDRTAFDAMVDDSGSGTDGTIWDKAAIEDTILDPIDAALLSTAACIDDTGDLSFAASTELTIATGAVVVLKNVHSIDTESNAASDDLDTLTAGTSVRANHFLILKPENAARVVTVKHNTGNIKLNGGDFVMNDANRRLTLEYNGTSWTETSRSGAGVNALLDGTNHSDTLAGTVVRGDMVVGNSTPKWARVAIGSTGKVWTSDGTDPSWQTPTSGNPTEQTTTSTGTQNDFSLSAKQTTLRCNNATALTMTGFTISGNAPVAGDTVTIVNIGTSTVKVAHQNASSTAAYRAICPSTNGQIIGAGGIMFCVYDDTTDRWRLACVDPGAWISQAYSSGDFTAAGSMTWTVDSGDDLMYRFQQHGTKILVEFDFESTSVGGTPDQSLRVVLPGGFTAANQATILYRAFNAGTEELAQANTASGDTKLYFRRVTAANWSAATNSTYVLGTAFIEVQ